MNLDELQSVQSRERQTDQLQQLRSTFYEEAGQFVNQLRDERDRAAERADDPFDAPEVNRLTDDIKTAEQTVEAIYERRIGKIVKMASLAAADMPTEDDGLTQEETDLFETMVEAIKRNRTHVLDVIAGEAPTGTVGEGTDTADPVSTAEPSATDPTPNADHSPPTDESSVDAADVMGTTTAQSDPAQHTEQSDEGGPDTSPTTPPERESTMDRPADEANAAVGADPSPTPPPESPSQTGEDPVEQTQPDDPQSQSTDDGIDRQTVRITDDVGPILGVDQREYDLSTDDVVTLPRDNAAPLVEKNAAEPLE